MDDVENGAPAVGNAEGRRGLAALTSRAAVEAALSEYDDTGQDAFLSKYGFGPSRSYFLIANGRRYDSKAIVGAAYGFEHPDLGPLRASEFSGGESTVPLSVRVR